MVEILTSSVDVRNAPGNKDLSINSRIFLKDATTVIGTVRQKKIVKTVSIFFCKLLADIGEVSTVIRQNKTQMEKARKEWHAAPRNELMMRSINNASTFHTSKFQSNIFSIFECVNTLRPNI